VIWVCSLSFERLWVNDDPVMEKDKVMSTAASVVLVGSLQVFTGPTMIVQQGQVAAEVHVTDLNADGLRLQTWEFWDGYDASADNAVLTVEGRRPATPSTERFVSVARTFTDKDDIVDWLPRMARIVDQENPDGVSDAGECAEPKQFDPGGRYFKGGELTVSVETFHGRSYYVEVWELDAGYSAPTRGHDIELLLPADAGTPRTEDPPQTAYVVVVNPTVPGL